MSGRKARECLDSLVWDDIEPSERNEVNILAVTSESLVDKDNKAGQVVIALQGS